ncbi:MAG: ATP-binding cassette domain-containing protein [Gammaproteobacteria bacterium]|nr:MAG: ATP-binding cassette domain-containing protein [Gammaproteobacteria bacterium]UTW43319.1 ATP-binding cassette domain-containing protein [bacterium SCSIO 12844]
MLNISKLSVSVDSKKILNNISLEINQGETLAIIGPNGAGKSSLLKAILSLYEVDGKIEFNNLDLSKLSFLKRAKLIAYLAQSTTMSLNFQSHEVIRLGLYPYRHLLSSQVIGKKVNDIMKLTDVLHLKDQDYFSLSGGEKQRVQLARVLLQLNLIDDNEPKLLLLDEHVSHLDIAYQHSILSLIENLTKAKNLTVIMVLHDMNLVLKYANKVAVINHGELYSVGNTEDVITEKMINDVYQMKFVLLPQYNQGLIMP